MNDQVDRYSLERQIGKGGMAEVFLANADGPHGFRKPVAIKRILQRHTSGDNDYEERFIREARIAVSLGHANIVQILDFGSADGALYIVMEYVEGSELRKVLRDARETGQGARIELDPAYAEKAKAISAKASVNPSPAPRAKANPCSRPYPRLVWKIANPKIAQLVVINGR